MEVVTRGYTFFTNYNDEVCLEDDFEGGKGRAFFFTKIHPKTGEMIKATLEQVLEFIEEAEEYGFLEKRQGEGVWSGFTFFKILEVDPKLEYKQWKDGAPPILEKTCGYCVSFHDFKSSEKGTRICKEGKEVNHLSENCEKFKKVLMMFCPLLRGTQGWTNIFVCQTRRGCFDGTIKDPASKTCVECSSFTGDKRLTKF